MSTFAEDDLFGSSSEEDEEEDAVEGTIAVCKNETDEDAKWSILESLLPQHYTVPNQEEKNRD